MVDISPELLVRRAAEYRESEPFAIVEADRVETLPNAFRDGSILWKDCEWIVRWYARRPLDGQTHPAEAAFRENQWVSVTSQITALNSAETFDEQVSALLALRGIDVEIASAFLQFYDPDNHAALAPQCWGPLRAADLIDRPYPKEPQPSDLREYLTVCRSLADEARLPVIDVGRALWRLGIDPAPGE